MVKEKLPPVSLIPKEVEIPGVPPIDILGPVVWTPTTRFAVPISVTTDGTIIDKTTGTVISGIDFGNRLVEIPCISVTC